MRYPAMEIREVREDLIEPVKMFLSNRPEFPGPPGWEGLFNYHWTPPGYPYGYAILDKGLVVAFVGTIFSERLIAGTKRLCCNLTTWFVEPQYRARMLGPLLLSRILSIDGLLITSFTPSKVSQALCEKMGFEYLERYELVVPIVPGISSVGRNHRQKTSITFNVEEIQHQLNEHERRILRDHATLPCQHFLVRNGTGAYCYGIATTTPLGKFRTLKRNWLNLCYLSDPFAFARSFRSLQNQLWTKGRFALLRCDARLLPPDFSRIAMRRQKARQFKSKEPFSATVDNLYSELITFNKY